MQISFIIPHKGRHELLQQTVASIFRQDYDLEQIEVIIVSQNNDLSESAVCNDSKQNVQVIHRPESDTISALRNHGVAHSSGEYLAFLDADVELAPNWIEAMLQELRHSSDRVLVSAAQTCAENAPVLEKIRTVLSNADLDKAVSFLPGRNLFLSRKSFDSSSGFPEHLITCEDYYFTHEISQQGDLYYSSKSNYIHLGEDKKLNEMFQKEKWRGQSNLQSLKGRPVPLREVPSFLLPFWIFFFALLSVFALVSVDINLLLFSLVMVFVPISLYSLRLYKIADGKINMRDILSFYAVYFPARVIGTIGGLVKIYKV